MNIEQFLGEPTSTEWVVDKLIPKGHKILLAGKPGSGKSWFLEGLAVHVAENVPFLGFNVKGGSVLLVDEETPSDVLKTRISKLYAGLNISKPSNNLEISSMEGFYLDTELGQQKMLDYINDKKPVLVVLDVLNRLFHHLEENEAKDITNIFHILSTFQRVCGSTIILVHHYGKSGNGKNFLKDVRGSSAIVAASDTAFGVSTPQTCNGMEFVVEPVPRKLKLETSPFRVKLTDSQTYVRLEHAGVWNSLPECDIEALCAVFRHFHGYGQDQTVNEVTRALGGLHTERKIRESLRSLSRDNGPLVLHTQAHNLFKYNLRSDYHNYLVGKFEFLKENVKN